MVRCVIADETLLPYLKSLIKINTCTVGLILGQPTPTKDYIFHIAKTPECQDSNGIVRKDIKEIQDIWVADHAKQATRLLSGGMYVLGIFIVSQNDLLTPFSPKIKSILYNMHKQLGVNAFLHGNPSTSERLVLNYCMKTHSYSCKSYDVAMSAVKPVDFRFQAKPTEWKLFECKYELDQVLPIIQSDIDLTLKKHMTGILELISENLKSAVFSFDGEIKENMEDVILVSLNKTSRHKNVSNADSVQVAIYLPCDYQKVKEPVELKNYSGQIKLTGQVACKVWLHSKATVQEVTSAITEDLIRSLAARLEMHWDSLIEEEHGSPEDTNSIHEPPRRVKVILPKSDITVCDYLFPGEGPQDAQESLKDLLDITITDEEMVKDIEGQADLMNMYTDRRDILEAESHDKILNEVTDTHNIMYLVGVGFAFLVLIISLIMHFLDIHF